MSLLPIPQGYGRVLLAASGGLILNTVHSFSIGTYFRRRAGIILPQLYATPDPDLRTQTEQAVTSAKSSLSFVERKAEPFFYGSVYELEPS